MNIDNIIFTTRPMTIRDHILCQRAAKGDYESMAAYIMSRTNLTADEVLDLDDDDLLLVADRLTKAALDAVALQQIAKALDVYKLPE